MKRRPARKSRWPNLFDDDPVMKEIRAVRRRMSRDAGGTVEGFLQNMRRSTAAAARAVSASGSPPRAAKRRPAA